ncbi:MAG: guanylate kinase [Candidatus Bipolaricaulota bacterium]|nr:guanylate kinase [Candidatus Bipolaricaulota bacterium]MBS3791206.1 guanylate kinase [Candidatus Bipolaricaulota bacterium]
MSLKDSYESYRKNGIFFVITGPSGVGKTTIMDHTLESDERLAYSISHTTRDRRPEEVDGEDYYFVDREEFEGFRKEDRFLEWAEIYGDYYGTSREEIDRIKREGRDPFLDIDVQGAAQLRADPSVNPVFVFLAPPSLEELERRIDNRGAESPEVKEKRMGVAREELSRIPEFDYLIVNEKLKRAVEELEAVIKAERLKV